MSARALRLRRERPAASGVEFPVAADGAAEAAAVMAFDDRSLWRAMTLFLVPQTASAVLQLVSSTITAVYFGQMLGQSALAVASVFFPVFFLLISFLVGLISGGIVLVGQAYGAGDQTQIKAVTGTTLCVSTLLSLVLATLGVALAPQLLVAMATPADILSPATNFARVTFVTLPLLTAFFGYTHLLRGTGDTRTPLMALALSLAIALVVTPALIKGWLGLPAMGLASAPLANLAACAVSLPALMIYLRLTRHPMAPDRVLLSHFRIDRRIAGAFLRLGLPGGVQLAMVSLSGVAVVTFVNAFGSGATAIYGVLNQVISYVLAPTQGAGMAAAVFGAQAIGAHQARRLGAVTRTATLLSLVVSTTTIATIYLFAPSILSWFLSEPATQSLAHQALRIALWSYVLAGISLVLVGVMQASGAVIWPASISIAAIWLVEVPAAYVLSRHLGLNGVWIAYPLAISVAFAAHLTYYCLVWRHRAHQKLL